MTHSVWKSIKESNRFYIHSYRNLGTVLFISGIINIVFIVGIYFCYFTQSKHDFYATNGETPPIELTALDKPNDTSIAMLEADSESEMGIKAVPE